MRGRREAPEDRLLLCLETPPRRIECNAEGTEEAAQAPSPAQDMSPRTFSMLARGSSPTRSPPAPDEGRSPRILVETVTESTRIFGARA